MTTSDIIIQNKEIYFISGIKIPNPGEYYEIEISGSHQRMPRDFQSIQFSLLPIGETDQIEIRFQKPNNYLNFKLSIVGGQFKQDLMSFNFLEPYSDEEIKENLSNKKMAFLGCARNCGSTLSEAMEVMSKIGSHFNTFKIFIAENNSTDGTLDILKELQYKYPLKLFAFQNLDHAMPLRTQRLSYCRNALLNAAIDDGYDYLCMADLDGVFNASLDIDKFMQNWRFEKCWDACFPVNQGIYYDLWALRHPEILPEDFAVKMNRADFNLGDLNIYNLFVAPIQNFDFTQLSNWLEVDSAFGGMGIYKAEAVRNARYVGFKNGKEVCEHVEFHKQMKYLNHCKLYINPKFSIKGI